MIVCVCRNIRDTDYATTEELVARLEEDDVECGKCLEYVKELNDPENKYY